MGKLIPTIRKGETKQEYRDRLLNGTSKFNQKIDKFKKRDTSNDDDIYDGKKFSKQEPKEQTTASSAGSSEPALSSPLKKIITKIPNSKKIQADEQTAISAGGGGFDYDVPAFAKTPKGRKDSLSIEGEKSVKSSRAVTDKNFPKWGGPESVFIKVKEKCKKFPYCNQGDINSIEPLKEAIVFSSKKYGLPVSVIEKMVLNEIKQIFI